MIGDIDKDGSGSIDFEEFLDMMTAKMSDKDSREDIMKVFNLFDDDQSGIRYNWSVSQELGETMTDAELLEMIERADNDQDGEINFEEFYASWLRRPSTKIQSYILLNHKGDIICGPHDAKSKKRNL